METALVYNLPFCLAWAKERIPGGEELPDETGTIGLMKDGKIVAVCVYSGYTKTGIVMNIASDNSKRWLTRDFLRACFFWPFEMLKVRRVTGLVRMDNLAAQKFDEHLGFVREGVLRDAEEDGTDVIIYGMRKCECKWIK